MKQLKQLKKDMKRSFAEYKASQTLLKKKANKEYPYFPSMFKDGKKRPSAKGRVIVMDSENIGLIPDLTYGQQTDAHVIHCRDKETGETFKFFDPFEFRSPSARQWLEAEGSQDGFWQDGIKFLNEADVIIAQNWLGYDDLALQKLSKGLLKVDYEAKPRGGKDRRLEYPFRVMDTMVMSQVLNPDRKPPRQAYANGAGNVGPHSIEAHGWRMGRPKPENEDWSELTDHMLFRCAEDVEIGSGFYDYLLDEWEEQMEPHPVTGLTIEDAYRVEAFVCSEMAYQEARGFRLDLWYAWDLVKELDEETERILKEAMPHMPLRVKMKKLNHATMRTACEKAGHEYTLDKKLKREVGFKHLGMYKDDFNKKRLKKWKKAGGKKKHFIEANYKPVYEKETVTHGSYRSTNWNFVTQTGNYSANTKKDYPTLALGNINDHEDPVVVGPYTPVVWEEITLGNRDIVRQTLYHIGWRGVNPTESEEEYLNEHGELPYYYAGKLDDDSIKAWKERAEKAGEEVPQWAEDILKYYIVTHRRTQILNKKDMEYYREHGHWPTNNGFTGCRGLVPRAVDVSSGKEFQYYMEQYGLKYWDKRKFLKSDEFRVPAIAFAIGTNTHRMRHKNVVNIPARGLYGKEMRKLFIASEGFLILGCDGAGLELRMLSHFMNDPEYEDILLNGDIHTHNQEKAGLPLRDIAKTFIYAFLYGSGIANLAMVCGMSEAEMQIKVEQFLEELPQLKDLVEGVQEVARERGYMKAVDGREGKVRKSNGKVKEHTALNVLLQMTGSICMKWGLYLAVKEMRKQGIDARLVANVHDEIQMEVPESEVERIQYKVKSSDWKQEEKRSMLKGDSWYYSAPNVIKGNPKEDKKITVERTFHKCGDILCKGFEDAGKFLGIRTPLAGEYQIGKTWADTH